jgi:hypothetical protein
VGTAAAGTTIARTAGAALLLLLRLRLWAERGFCLFTKTSHASPADFIEMNYYIQAVIKILPSRSL